ncbi:MAG: hypothetical protein JSW51_12490 [Gemmatimonadota bacterium]|nr:MAG: hypothetical protein JSW51_12490 [Gemmatimonadota bacterium]
MRVALALALMVIVACSPTVESDASDEVDQEDEPGTTRRTLEELPPMPGYPDARDGRLVVISDGDFAINRVWDAAAGYCEKGMLELYAEDDSSGTVVVLHFPDSIPLGEYPIVLAGPLGAESREARIGVQVFDGREAFALQAFMGSLEITEFGDRVSGRFASTLREMDADVLTRYVGVFNDVRASVFPEDYCKVLYPEDDAQMEPDSSASSDSASGSDQV